MASLYRINSDYEWLMELLEDSGGEITEEIEVLLKRLQQDRDSFIDNACKDYTNIVSDNHAIDGEIERLGAIKERNLKRMEKGKQLIKDVMKLFDMKNTKKGSTNYVFRTPIFSGYTKISKSVNLNEARLYEDFAPLSGTKSSKYVNYAISAVVDKDSLEEINKLQILPATSYIPKVDKKLVKEYLEDVQQGLILDFDDNQEIVIDPIADIANIVSNESLIIQSIK